MVRNCGQWWCAWYAINHLLKKFDIFSHNFFIKPEAYKFEISSLRLIYDYLSNRAERVKVHGEN